MLAGTLLSIGAPTSAAWRVTDGLPAARSNGGQRLREHWRFSVSGFVEIGADIDAAFPLGVRTFGSCHDDCVRSGSGNAEGRNQDHAMAVRQFSIRTRDAASN
jgi:hypothetical protein